MYIASTHPTLPYFGASFLLACIRIYLTNLAVIKTKAADLHYVRIRKKEGLKITDMWLKKNIYMTVLLGLCLCLCG